MNSDRYPRGYLEELDGLIAEMVSLSPDIADRNDQILHFRERVTKFVFRWSRLVRITEVGLQ